METIAGDERYPTGTVDVNMVLDELGEHEIEGVCTFQTFDLDLEWLLEEMGDGDPAGRAAGDRRHRGDRLPAGGGSDHARRDHDGRRGQRLGGRGGRGADRRRHGPTPVAAAPAYTG